MPFYSVESVDDGQQLLALLCKQAYHTEHYLFPGFAGTLDDMERVAAVFDSGYQRILARRQQ